MQHAPAELLHFIKNSPTCYHVTENIRQKLLANGYTELSERERWEVAPGGKYFVRRNGSSTIAFRVPEMIDGGFAMAAAHSDSPAFRLKEHPDRRSAHYVQLSTEKYGGMLMSTWFDRPLSVAGRVFVRANGEIVEKLVSVDRDLLVIPNVAIHMNRTANDGMKYMANVDTLPLLGGKLTGYDQPDAVLTAVETRSSSPVRILRDENYESNIRGLYPCGEGAGYAGGILSAAADGMRAAEKLWEVYEK